MAKYDLQDPTDLDIMKGTFDGYSDRDWEEYIEQAEKNDLGFKNINALKSAQKRAGMGKFLSPKMLQWILNLVDDLDERQEEEEKGE